MEDKMLKLTDRESEVANLVATGISNSQIAAKIFLSQRTIETYVSNILRKTGLKNRTQITLWIHKIDG
jgi:DNA-binding NarL/FixJ family response regulator